MKWKNLVPLAVILAILAVLVVLKKAQDRPVDIREQVRMAALVPEGLSYGELTRIELFAGGAPEDKVVLERDADDANAWRATSHFNAPVAAEKIEEYLKKLAGLKGEYRAVADTEEALKTYSLDDAQAFHVLAYRKGEERPVVELLVGKAPHHQQSFVRVAGGKEVHVSNVNFRREAGVWSEETDKAPTHDTWLDKKVLEVDRERIDKLALTLPDKTLVFERREKEKEPPAEPDENDPAAAPPADTAPEYEWVVLQGGPGTPHRQTGLDNILGSLRTLTASDIVDPESKIQWGLEEPAFRCAISFEGEEPDIVIEGGRPDPAGDGYVRVAGAKQEVVYKLFGSTFNNIFPKGADLFDLPRLAEDRDTIQRIEVTQPEGAFSLAKEGDSWAIASPRADLDPATTAITSLVDALASWRASDYADAAADAQLDPPARTATFHTGDARSHTIRVGAPSPTFDGSYARLDDNPTVLAMSRGDINKVFIAPKDLYQRSVFDFHDDQVAAVTIRREDETVELARGEEGWSLSINGAAVEADSAAAEDLAMALSDLQVADILFDRATLEGEPYATITVALEGDVRHVLTLGPRADAGYPLMIEGRAQLLLVSDADAEALAPPAAELKAPEPPEEPAEESAPAEEAPNGAQ